LNPADIATAVDRETAWLTAYNPADGLPALLTANGGPWDAIQAYTPRTAGQSQSYIHVLRRGFSTTRWGQQRRMPTYPFHLVCHWPIGATSTGTNLAEDEQRAFDLALALVVQRIEGFVGEKSHGGRFLSAGESPNGTKIDVTPTDPAQTIPSGYLEAVVTYLIDDNEYVM
jgi:hypothetical protein